MSVDNFKSVCCLSYRSVHLIESIVTVKWLENSRNQHQVSVLERCQSYREYIVTVNWLENGRDQHQVSVLERCLSYREYSYSKMTEKWQEPTPGVHLIENIVTVKWLQNSRNRHQVSVLERCQSYREYMVTVKLLENSRNQLQVSVLEKCRSYREYSYSKMIEKWQGPTPGVHLREVSDLKRCPLRERVDCNILISIFIIDLHRSHYKILKVMNLIFTGCIVPPATTTARASLTTLVKCTAGFNRRNFKLEQLSRPVERYMYNDLWYRYACICCGSIHPWFEFYSLLLFSVW